jgi:uncharacterized lipoprotein
MLPAVFLLAGCATTPQAIQLNLQPDVPVSSQGHDVRVVVRVVDKRSGNILGYQTHENGEKKNPITTVQDVAKTIYQALAQGLRRQGFGPHQYRGPSEARPRLTVTLEKLSYTRNNQGIGNQIHVQAKLAANADTVRQKYHAVYTVDKNKRHDLVDSKKENAKLVNAALTQALQNLLSDRKLIAAMAGSGAPQTGSDYRSDP